MLLRSLAGPAEVRAEGRTLFGLAAPFNSETSLYGGREVIRPGAFKRSLADGGDILALADHNPAAVLARTRGGSLKLEETSRGLAFSFPAPQTTTGNDALELVRSGLAGGMSFGFLTRQQRVTGDLRELLDVDLREISLVSSWPAYGDTQVSARARRTSLQDIRMRLKLRIFDNG